jgi:hypothetical protein
VVYVVPADETALEAEQQLTTIRGVRGEGQSLLIVRTKADLSTEPNFAADVAVSVWQEQRLATLCTAIVERLVGAPPAADAAVPFLPEQIDMLKRVQSLLKSRNTTAARELLASRA